MRQPDLIEWIRAELLARQPAMITIIDPVLQAARREYGGDTVYVRSSPPIVRCGLEIRKVTRRTLQNRQRNETERV